MRTPPTPEEWAARARNFGKVADAYDRARPTYPRALVDDLVSALPGTDIAETGAGTGKATALFVAAGLRLTCIEPDPRMAAVLKNKLPDVDITICSFEEWRPPRRFDGLLAAQSWHWTDPASRYDKAAAALGEGGILAVFWNETGWQHAPLRRVVDDIYRRNGLVSDERHGRANKPDWLGQLRALDTFTDVERRTYPWTRTYSAREWCDYLATTSDHLLLDPAIREALLADVARVIDSEGGGRIEVPRHCDLYLARRRRD